MNYSFDEIVLEPYGFIWLTPTEKTTSKHAQTTIIDVLVETEFGEDIHIVGNLPELGAWNPEKTIGPLSPEAYPSWIIELELPANTYFEFQWVKKRNGRIIEWSPDKFWMKSGDEISYY